ncbi:hypothetical protein EJ08DRAFT_653324 [Tothia fuscella]|uniref:Ubiquitin 3 binding protein But2 C-terminal domain-containing protein n=1 Tax=Tothia fuscella TaxID=1048955 RepID=A0A9P4NHK6_9PEZI|nr:hypothetical protein EJ08DRAFT_653324 [Tothia fuscella]
MKSFTAIISVLIATAAAAPTPSTNGARQAPVSIKPIRMSTYFGSTGAVRLSTEGHIQRFSGQSDQSTLLTFDIPKIYEEKDCAFALTLDGANDFASGSKQLDIFTSIKPATADAASWPSGNLRDQAGGRMRFYGDVQPGAASYVNDIAHPASSFKCPSGVFGGELVPVGDKVDIYWTSYSSGPSIVVLNP